MNKYRKYRNICLWTLFIPFAGIITITTLATLLFRDSLGINIGSALLIGFIPVLSLVLLNMYVQIFVVAGFILAIYFHIKYRKQKNIIEK